MGLFGWGKIEVWERVGFGCTAPSWRRERAKSGSEASRLMASSRVPLACGCGRTVGPAWPLGAADGCVGGAFVVAEGAVLVVVFGDGREGYLRAAAPATLRDAFEPEDPIEKAVYGDCYEEC